MHEASRPHRPCRTFLAFAIIAATLGASGCTTSACRDWAQNAPTIRSETPASHDVQLGAWGERGARKD